MQTVERKPRPASPERWAKAAGRAVAESIEVRQIATTGQWVASSGTNRGACYLLEVVNGVVRACTCPAGDVGDPCCKHAARFYLDAGVLDAARPACRVCGDQGFLTDPDGKGAPERCFCAAGQRRAA